jgi:hypothetical protein
MLLTIEILSIRIVDELHIRRTNAIFENYHLNQ